ncbi:MAG: hypothetical protein ACP5T0_04575 [Verrucomicrobiia bacterium]
MKKLLLLAVMGLALAGYAVFAQDSGSGSGDNGGTTPPPEVQPPHMGTPPAEPPAPPTDGMRHRPGKIILPPRPEPPGRPGIEPPVRPELPQEIKDLIAQFEQAKQDFLTAQKDLLEQLKNATTDEERAQIREQLKAQRDAWLEQTKELRQQIREALKELRDKIPTRQEVLDRVREQQNSRPRRGDDTQQ